MSVRFEAFKTIETKINEILNELIKSEETYEMNIKEEKLNDKYEDVKIHIRKINKE